MKKIKKLVCDHHYKTTKKTAVGKWSSAIFLTSTQNGVWVTKDLQPQDIPTTSTTDEINMSFYNLVQVKTPKTKMLHFLTTTETIVIGLSIIFFSTRT